MGLDLKQKGLTLFCALVFILATVNYYFYQSRDDAARCKAVLGDGFWLDQDHSKNWQPAGCMMHHYKSDEVVDCLDKRHIMLVGGAHALQIYERLGTKLDPKFESPGPDHESNVVATASGVRLDFIWDPYLNGGKLDELEFGYDQTNARPAITLIFPGYEILRKEEHLTNWVYSASELAERFSTSVPQKDRQSDVLVVAPFIQPDLKHVSSSERDLFNPIKVDFANDILRSELERNGVDGAYAFNLLTRDNGTIKGLRISDNISDLMAELLLNRRCNSQLPKHYPYASTCCNTYPKPSWIQIAIFAFICLVIPAANLVHMSGLDSKRAWLSNNLPSSSHVGPILTLGMAIVLSYFCDRTNIFGKEHKQTEPSQFFLGMFLITVVSLFTIKTSDKEEAFLNRDQTDEWKGWMQVAILVYHYVGVSKTEYIYNYMRVCPTSYLFMTGFGNTYYFLKKGDYSFKRVAATMLRLNLLNVLLAYAMGTDWLLYYFAPLVTWNFFVLFFILWIGNQHNKNFKVFLGKLVAGSILNTGFYRVPGVLEAAWWMLQILFRMQGDLREWRFRVTLDQYSMLPGMMAAWLFLNWNELQFPKARYWMAFQRFATLVSLAIMIGYAFFETSFASKQEYNRWHTYVSWLPCCAFVVLRNSTSWLRRTHNKLFAWFGRGSLETFLLQFHLWLAADTVGLLNVGLPHHRFLNFLITSTTFLFISSLATSATGPVIEWIMGTRPKAPPVPPTCIKPDMESASESKESSAGQANGDVETGLNGSASSVNEKTEMLKSAETGLTEVKAPATTGSSLTQDLRVRAVIILTAMAVANWTYYL